MAYLLALILLISAKPASATSYQQCAASSTCVIGEYLYDDEYSPDTGANCTLTSKYPNGTTFLNAVSATGTADGWYSYTASIGTTTGTYPSNLCCTSGTEYLCIDKTFEVSVTTTSSSLTAADVWEYSSRSLSSFGDLAADVWSHSSRSLSSFGDLVGNIWNFSSDTTQNPAVIQQIITEQEEQRVLLEKMVNEPIVTISLEDNDNLLDLTAKISDSLEQANKLYDAVKISKAKLTTLSFKQARLSEDLINQELANIASLLDHTIALEKLNQLWDSPIVDRINTSVNNIYQNLTHKDTTLESSLIAITELEKLLGDATSSSNENSLFGFLAFVNQRNDTLENQKQQLAALLEDWNGQGEANLSKEISSTRKTVLSLNLFPGGKSLIEPIKPSSNIKQHLKNVAFNLKALLGLNQKLLAARKGETISSVWLEEGSIIFRAVITNPSEIITQTANLKFNLPKEVKTENIIDLDPTLSSKYDTAEEAVVVTGSYSLSPLTSTSAFIEIEDIWQLTASELESLKNQAAELIKPLEKTSYFSQGTVLKSSIDTSLDKIIANQIKAITPENRIRTYREAQLELNSIKTNIARLQDLVVEATGTGSIFGFVGGVQAVSVWGILLVILASFVFLTLYMKQLKEKENPKKEKVKTKIKLTTIKPATVLATNKPKIKLSPAVIPVIAIAGLTVSVVVGQLSNLSKPDPTILQVNPPSLQPSPEPTLPTPPTYPTKQLTVPENSSINIRNAPSIKASIVMKIKKSRSLIIFNTKDDWSQVGYTKDNLIDSWWVSSQFLD